MQKEEVTHDFQEVDKTSTVVTGPSTSELAANEAVPTEEKLGKKQKEESVDSGGNEEHAPEEKDVEKPELDAIPEEAHAMQESESNKEKKDTKPSWNYDSSSSDDDAPEEVGNTSGKQHTLELYELRKQAALATKRRKRKQRVSKTEETLDKNTLQLLANNAEVLSAVTTPADDKPKSKVIHLTSEELNPTQTVEKQVDNFRVVSLSKDLNSNIGKPISRKILSFQRSHFYGKRSKRVDSGSYVQKLILRTRH